MKKSTWKTTFHVIQDSKEWFEIWWNLRKSKNPDLGAMHFGCWKRSFQKRVFHLLLLYSRKVGQQFGRFCQQFGRFLCDFSGIRNGKFWQNFGGDCAKSTFCSLWTHSKSHKAFQMTVLSRKHQTWVKTIEKQWNLETSGKLVQNVSFVSISQPVGQIEGLFQ